VVETFVQAYARLTQAASYRASLNEKVRAVRRGDVPAEVRDMFPDNWPASITSNLIDIAARDMAEMLGELPSVRSIPSSSSARESERSTRRTKIALGYIEQSGLQRTMYAGCDRLVTFGCLPFIVEPAPDFDGPVIRIGNATQVVYEKNLRGDVVHLFEHWSEPAAALQARHPDLPISRPGQVFMREPDTTRLTVVKYYGRDKLVTFLPEREGLILLEVDNPIGRVPAAVVELPQWDEIAHGAYDQAIWVQLARARVMQMAMQATDQALNAPLAVPPDVTHVPMGPGAVIHSTNPQSIQKVRFDVPREAWLESGALERENRIAARYPEGRSGNIDASVITGQGVQALLGTIDSQLKTLQTLIGFELRRILAIAFQMDEALRGEVKKTITGWIKGKKFSEEYRPSRDIAGDYDIDVNYGFMSGLDQNRATVMMLQLLGAGLVDKQTVQEQLPFPLDVDDVQERLDRESIEEALRVGVQGMLSNIGSLAAEGQDPTDLLVKAATLIEQREKGVALAQAILEVFKPPEDQPKDPFAQALGQAPPGPVPGAGAGPGVQTPGQPGGGRLMQMLAGLSSSGNPAMSTRVMQQTPAA